MLDRRLFTVSPCGAFLSFSLTFSFFDMYDMKASFFLSFWFRFVDLISSLPALVLSAIVSYSPRTLGFVFMFLCFSFSFGLALSFVSVSVSSHRTSQTRLDHCHRVYGVWHDRTLDLFLFIEMCADGRLWRTVLLCTRFDSRWSMGYRFGLKVEGTL